MSAFDEMTLGEVEDMTAECLNGKSFQDAEPLTLAGAVMYMTHKRENPMLDWQTFKRTTTMVAIKEFSIQLEADELDPTNGRNVPTG
jgi:hypothetical protein